VPWNLCIPFQGTEEPFIAAKQGATALEIIKFVAWNSLCLGRICTETMVEEMQKAGSPTFGDIRRFTFCLYVSLHILNSVLT
jgi:hypothetical protein